MWKLAALTEMQGSMSVIDVIQLNELCDELEED